jgi:hypothetical protein
LITVAVVAALMLASPSATFIIAGILVALFFAFWRHHRHEIRVVWPNQGPWFPTGIVSLGVFALMILPEAPTKGRLVCASVLALIAVVRLRGLRRKVQRSAGAPVDQSEHTGGGAEFVGKLSADEGEALETGDGGQFGSDRAINLHPISHGTNRRLSLTWWPPPVMIESAASDALITRMLCCSWAMCFSTAVCSEKYQGSMNLLSKTAPVLSTMPSRVAAIQRTRPAR